MSKSKSVHFFATKRDLEHVLKAVEDQRSLAYVKGGMSVSVHKQVLTSGLQIPSIGIAVTGDQNREPWYLVTDSSIDVQVASVAQRGGGRRYVIDQRMNPQSITLTPGGIFEGRSIVAGAIGTCSEDDTSNQLFKLFAKEFRSQFTKIKSYYVGDEAAQLLESGLRLTADVRSPAEFDLTK